MAGSSNPGYSADMHQYPIPDNDTGDVQPQPMIDWATPIPGQPTALVDALTGDTVQPGHAFTRVVSTSGETDVQDPGV